MGWLHFRLSRLGHCRTTSRPGAVIDRPWTQCNLEAELKIRYTTIPLSEGLQFSPWAKCLVRNLAPEETYDLCLNLNSGFVRLGNQSSLNIIMSGSPCIMTEAGGHDHVPEGVHHSRIALPIIVSSWLTQIAPTGW